MPPFLKCALGVSTIACIMLAMTFGEGNSGRFEINAKNRMTLDGGLDSGIWHAVMTTTSMPFGPTIGGDAGDIIINANDLLLNSGGMISSSTVGFYGIKSRRAGNITLNVPGTIKISGVNPYGNENYDEIFSSSSLQSKSHGNNNTGESGNIFINTGSLIMERGGTISNLVRGDIPAGRIDIHASDMINISGDSSNELFIPGKGVKNLEKSGIYSNSINTDIDSGSSGKIILSTDLLLLDDKGTITTSCDGGGNAGNIFLDVNNIVLNNNASIFSSSNHESHGGSAGTITINADNSIRLMNNSKLSTEAVNSTINNDIDNSLSGKLTLAPKKTLLLFNSEISTSVKGGSGSGGDIDINQAEFVTLNKSNIIANAYEGSGGK